MLSRRHPNVAHRAFDVEAARPGTDRHFLARVAKDYLLAAAFVHRDLAQGGACGDLDTRTLLEVDRDVTHLTTNLRRAPGQPTARGEVACLSGEVESRSKIRDLAAARKDLCGDGSVNAVDAQRASVDVHGEGEVGIHPDLELPAPNVHGVDQGAAVAATEAELVVLVEWALLDDHGVAILSDAMRALGDGESHAGIADDLRAPDGARHPHAAGAGGHWLECRRSRSGHSRRGRGVDRFKRVEAGRALLGRGRGCGHLVEDVTLEVYHDSN